MTTSSRDESITTEWPPAEDATVTEWPPPAHRGAPEWPPPEDMTAEGPPSEAGDPADPGLAEDGDPTDEVVPEDGVAADSAPSDEPDHPKGKKRRLPWKPIVGVVVTLLIGWQVFQGMTKGGGEAAGRAAVSPASQTPATVTLGAATISAGGEPVLLLNPGLVAPGGQVGVQGSGFDPGAMVDVLLQTAGSEEGTEVAMAEAAEDGSIQAQFTAPESTNESSVTVVAQQRGSDKSATAELVSQGGAATVSIDGKASGKPGDHVTINATGFTAGEEVQVFWGRSTGTPSATLTADPSGALSEASVPVGMAPVGTTTLVLVGVKSHATAIAAFQMLGLYPTSTPDPYSVLPGKDMTYSGSGFAPGEQVLVYFNASGGTPALTLEASASGDFTTSFTVPFGLNGSQTLTAIGAQSRAATSTGFSVLSYTPTVQASTYEALPGTSISFYASGFAADEVVEVYLGRGEGSAGELVTAFRVGAEGSAAAAGQYVIPSGSGPTLDFTLVGQQSDGAGTASVGVGESANAANVPAQPPYVLPAELGGEGSSEAPASPSGSPSPAPAPAPAPTPESSSPESSSPAPASPTG